MHADVERFYALLAHLAALPLQGGRLADYTGRSPWPARGVYFFREPGECRTARPKVPRVVRVGTHAVSANAKSTLWGRLRTHRGGRTGGGNHRSSIFRLHVGAALLGRGGGDLPTWGAGSSASRPIRMSEDNHERRASAYIGGMSVLWVAVPDDPGPSSARALIERNTIALLSNGLAPCDAPSEEWLGRWSPCEKIRRSGLWNLKHVEERYAPSFLDTLEEAVAEMEGL